MIKPQKRTIGAIVIILMLSTSPISVNYSFAEIEDNQKENDENLSKNCQKDRLGAILTEKIVDGKLEVRHYSLPEDISGEDFHRMLSFEGQTDSWAYVNYNAYQSGIVLFDGKVSKIGENLWMISTDDVLNLDEKQSDLELSEKYSYSHIKLHGTTSNEEFSYKIIFSGKIVETDGENIFTSSSMNSGLKNPETCQNIKLLQSGELTINLGKSINSNQVFRNSIPVR